MDVDDTVPESNGYAKLGVGAGYTGTIRAHLIAVPAHLIAVPAS